MLEEEKRRNLEGRVPGGWNEVGGQTGWESGLEAAGGRRGIAGAAREGEAVCECPPKQ